MEQCTCYRANCLSYHKGETYETRILRLTTASEAREERISSGARCEACVFDTQCEACYERAEIREYEDTMNEARYPSAEEVAAWELEIANELAKQRQHGRLSGETITDRWGYVF